MDSFAPLECGPGTTPCRIIVFTLDSAAATDPTIVGSKAAALTQMRAAGLPVPRGFVIGAGAFARALREHAEPIGALSRAAADPDARRETAAALRRRLRAAPLTGELLEAVTVQYDALGETVPVAVRSSALAEDLADASFAGQYDSSLNVSGASAVSEHVRRIWASAFSDRAVDYRERRGLPHDAVGLAVLVQELIPADRSGGSAGAPAAALAATHLRAPHGIRLRVCHWLHGTNVEP